MGKPELKIGQVWKSEEDELQLLVTDTGAQRAECLVLKGSGRRRGGSGHRVGKKASIAKDWLSTYCTVIKDDFYAGKENV